MATPAASPSPKRFVFDHTARRLFIGAMIEVPDLWPAAADLLTGELFPDPVHERFVEIIQDLHKKLGRRPEWAEFDQEVNRLMEIPEPGKRFDSRCILAEYAEIVKAASKQDDWTYWVDNLLPFCVASGVKRIVGNNAPDSFTDRILDADVDKMRADVNRRVVLRAESAYRFTSSGGTRAGLKRRFLSGRGRDP